MDALTHEEAHYTVDALTHEEAHYTVDSLTHEEAHYTVDALTHEEAHSETHYTVEDPSRELTRDGCLTSPIIPYRAVKLIRAFTLLAITKEGRIIS